MRPGVDVVSRALPAPILIPTDTGVSFVIGPTGAASTEIVGLVLSLTDYINRFGDRMDAPVTYDAVDAFFREGGSKLYVASTTKAVIDPPVTFAAGDSFDSMSRAELDRHAEGRGLNPSDYGTKSTPHGRSPTLTLAVTMRLSTSMIDTSFDGPFAVNTVLPSDDTRKYARSGWRKKSRIGIVSAPCATAVEATAPRTATGRRDFSKWRMSEIPWLRGTSPGLRCRRHTDRIQTTAIP